MLYLFDTGTRYIHACIWVGIDDNVQESLSTSQHTVKQSPYVQHCPARHLNTIYFKRSRTAWGVVGVGVVVLGIEHLISYMIISCRKTHCLYLTIDY